MADPVTPFRRTRVLRIVLAVSLAINLAVAGLAAGVALRGPAAHPPRDFEMGLGPVARALTKDDRAAIRDALRARGDLAPPRRNRSADLDTLVAALLAQPYDGSALRDALTAPAIRAARVQRAGAQALADRVDTMSAEQRAALAQRLTQMRGPDADDGKRDRR